MCSSELEEMGSSRIWESQRLGAAWVSVESAPVCMFTAATEGRVWIPAHLCSKKKHLCILVFFLTVYNDFTWRNTCKLKGVNANLSELYAFCCLNMSLFHSSKYSEKKQQRWQASHHVWLLLSAAASVHLGGKELSVVRPCPFVILNTTPLLFVPTAPPASLCQMDIPASALWGLQGSTARKVANLSARTASFYLFFIYLRTHSRPCSLIQHCFSCPAVSISDPFFSSNQSSWMSFPAMSVRHRTVVQLQFQPLSPDGILLYTAQHLSTRAGKVFNRSLFFVFPINKIFTILLKAYVS